MALLFQILQFVLCLSILVLLHEAGHFLAAKFFKTRVEKFYLFFNPWFSLFKKKIGDTEYGIGWLPLGGYVKISGMVDESMDKEQMKKEPQPWEFRAKPAWQRLIIILAGIIVNIILAIIIFTGILMVRGEANLNAHNISGYTFSDAGKQLGFQDNDKIIKIDGKEIPTYFSDLIVDIIIGDQVSIIRNNQEITFNIEPEKKKYILSKEATDFINPIISPIIDSVLPNSVINGVLQKGDIIESVNNERIKNISMLPEVISKHKNDSISLVINRNSQSINYKIFVPEEGRLGIYLTSPNSVMIYKKYSFFQALKRAPAFTWDILNKQIRSFKLIFNPKTEAYKSISGPLAMYKIFKTDEKSQKEGKYWNWIQFWTITGMLSVTLAFMNILPIPALDGGHAILLLGEMITGRKLSNKAMEFIQMIGMIIILALMVFVFGNDIMNLFFRK